MWPHAIPHALTNKPSCAILATVLLAYLWYLKFKFCVTKSTFLMLYRIFNNSRYSLSNKILRRRFFYQETPMGPLFRPNLTSDRHVLRLVRKPMN